MRRLIVMALAVALCLSLVPAAQAKPKGNGKGNAFAYGLAKQVDKDGKTESDKDVTDPAPPPATISGDWEYVTLFSGPLSISASGFVVPLYREVKTGYLGYPRASWLLSGPTYSVGGQPVKVAFNPVFDADPNNTYSGASWADPLHRITYAVDTYTMVTVNGVGWPYTSAVAQAALATPGIAWQCTYREAYDAYYSRAGGWYVSSYSPAQQ